MFLKSLETVGFKSFVEAKIGFPRGITAVVGPNGSGKSNVVDAILWVLGEQSTKTLRSERMEDVIFNGTQVRKPMGMAEVSLIIGGLQPGDLQGLGDLSDALRDYSEIMITRRLFRNGDSEYLINKTQCRLKDVRGVMMETRAGTKGHTVITQGQLDVILNASPQGRRELIEETAGIVRYKKQKAEALRKLDATQQNLVRVRDVIGEVKKQLNWLERQAQQARTYESLQREGRQLEIRLLTDDHRRLSAQSHAIHAQLLALDEQEAALAAEAARAESAQQAVKLEIHQQQEVLQTLRHELSTAEQERAQALAQVDVERNKLQLYEQQKTQAQADTVLYREEHAKAQTEHEDLERRLAGMDEDLQVKVAAAEEIGQRLREVLGQKEDLVVQGQRVRQALAAALAKYADQSSSVARLEARQQESQTRALRLAQDRGDLGERQERLRQQIDALARDRGELEEQLRLLRESHQTTVAAVQEAGEQMLALEQRRTRDLEQLAATESRWRTLQAVVREEMGYGREGEEHETTLRSCQGVREAIAEWLIVPERYERAVEAVLGERVRAWFVDDPRRATEAVAFLKQRELGRGTFVPATPRWASSAEGAAEEAWWQGLQGQPGVIGRAVELLHGQQGEVPEALSVLFHQVVLVEDLDAALRLWEHGAWAAPTGPTLVTLAGEVLDAAGILIGGLAGASAGILQRRREVQHLEGRRDELSGAIETGRRSREALQARQEELQATRRQLEAQLRDTELRVLALSKDHGGSEHNLAELAQRAERVAREEDALAGELRQIDEQLAAAREARATATAIRDEQEGHAQQVQGQIQEIEQVIAGVQEQSTSAKLALGALRSAREHATTTLGRLQAEIDDCAGRMATLAETVAKLVQAMQDGQERREQQEARCHQVGHRIDSVQAQMLEVQEAVAKQVELNDEWDRTLAQVRRQVLDSREQRTEVEVRRAQVDTQLDTVAKTLTGTYGVEAAAVIGTIGTAETAGTAETVEGEASGMAEGETPAEAPDPSASLLGEEELVTMRERLQKIRDRMARIGGVNLAAIDEHRELEERYRFLTAQEQDLTTSIKSLREIIQRINRTTKELFHETFAQLQAQFATVFQKVFPGGRAELIMVEPAPEGEGAEEGAAEPGVDIVAQPPGKRLKSITMLSGGEKALTATALLFASFLIRPTPFCILDEIDAPLDEENIGRFTGVLRELSSAAQFIVITHNKRTMAIADSLFGVTMEEPGVSKIVSVRIADLQPA